MCYYVLITADFKAHAELPELPALHLDFQARASEIRGRAGAALCLLLSG